MYSNAGLTGNEYLLNAFCETVIGKALEISFNSHTPQILPQLSRYYVYLGLPLAAHAAARNRVIFIRSLETQSSDDFKK